MSYAQQAFCLTAAALGHDPFSMSDAAEAVLARIGRNLEGGDLVLEVASAVDLSQLATAQKWVNSALQELESVRTIQLEVVAEALPTGRRLQPWTEGYRRAQRVRMALAARPTDGVDVTDLVRTREINGRPGGTISGLVDLRATSIAVAVPKEAAPTSVRFLAARGLGRRTYDTRAGAHLLTSSLSSYGAKLERAFAAELLAPAAGIEQLLGGDASDRALRRAAKHFKVDELVIAHQVENQLAA